VSATGPETAVAAAWTARLKCGHEARVQSEPRTGGYITCTDAPCQGQRRVTAAAPSGEPPLVQGTLFGECGGTS
jgi:hypothetical protein